MRFSITKVIIIGLSLLSLLSVVRAYYFNEEINGSLFDGAKKEAQVLNDYLMSTRKVYQRNFLKNDSGLGNGSLSLLPAHVSSEISNDFIMNGRNGFYVKSVSDNPRNPNNLADEEELKLIKRFKKDGGEKEYFGVYEENGVDFYQYATPIYVKASCLSCHGKKENAPEIIRRSYHNAYDYEVGDVRGIVSIRIPYENSLENISKFLHRELFFIALFLIVSVITLLVLYSLNKEEMSRMGTKAFRDALTGLSNRLFLEEFLREFKLGKEGDFSYAVVFMDLDNFKNVNDVHGHSIVDCVLKEVASRLTSVTRSEDVICRYGGEEFIAILIDADENAAKEKAERFRSKIGSRALRCKKINVTVSVGVSVGSNSKDIEKIMEEADKALYLAKEAGRNCTKVFLKTREEIN